MIWWAGKFQENIKTVLMKYDVIPDKDRRFLPQRCKHCEDAGFKSPGLRLSICGKTLVIRSPASSRCLKRVKNQKISSFFPDFLGLFFGICNAGL